VKQENDLLDILFLLEVMIDKGEAMAKDLKDLILTKEVVQAFWDTLPEAERVTYKDFLAQVGVFIAEVSSP
jgi:hypothetical protein